MNPDISKWKLSLKIPLLANIEEKTRIFYNLWFCTYPALYLLFSLFYSLFFPFFHLIFLLFFYFFEVNILLLNNLLPIYSCDRFHCICCDFIFFKQAFYDILLGFDSYHDRLTSLRPLHFHKFSSETHFLVSYLLTLL